MDIYNGIIGILLEFYDRQKIGGVGTFMYELYKYHSEDTGFVHIYYGNDSKMISTDDYPDTKDILDINSDEVDQVMYLSYDIAVIHDENIGVIVRMK